MSVLLKQNSINEQIKELCLLTIKDDVIVIMYYTVLTLSAL